MIPLHPDRVADGLRERGLLLHVKQLILTFHVKPEDAFGRTKMKRIVRARHACWAHLRGIGFSYPEIGAIWGVDHSTVLAACKRLGVR